MKHHTAIIAVLLLLFASTVSAQEQQKQDLPQQPLDNESGWKAIYTPAFIPQDYYIAGIQFPSKDTGYASYFNGNIFVLIRTINGGITWDSISNTTPGIPNFYNSLIGYCISSGMWKTVDGGLTWQWYGMPPGLYGTVKFFDTDTGAILGIGRSTDAGKTWVKVAGDPGIGNSKDLVCVNKQVGFMVGEGVRKNPDKPDSGSCAMFAKTLDAGKNWGRILNDISDNFDGCQGFDEQTIYTFSTHGNFYRSINGGISWDSINIGNAQTAGFMGMSFINKAHGILVGAEAKNNVLLGIIYSTNDSGKTWQKQPVPPNTGELIGIVMLNDSIAYATSEKSIYRTTTGGQASSVHQHTIDFHVQTFPNPTPGLITIQYQLPTASTISFRFYDLQGQTLGVVNPGIQEAGIHQIQYDGTSLSNGMYFFQLSTPIDSYTGQFSILK